MNVPVPVFLHFSKQTHIAIMIEELLEGMTPGKAVLWSLGIFTFFCILRKLQASAQIARLGARAPKIHFRLPYGMPAIWIFFLSFILLWNIVR